MNAASPPSLADAIQHSVDRLFFVRYTPYGTLRSHWYLVTVDLQQTAAEIRCGNPHETGRYYVHFLARHPADSDETDPQARWWPEWHEYRTDQDVPSTTALATLPSQTVSLPPTSTLHGLTS